MVSLPPFPTDDATLDLLMAAINPWSHGDTDAEHSSVEDILTLYSEMGGSDTRAVAEVIEDEGFFPIHVMRDPHYHINNVIESLIVEIRRLRNGTDD